MEATSEPLRILFSLPDRRARGGPPSHLYLLHDSLEELGVEVRSFLYGGRTHDEGKIRKALGRLADLFAFPLLVARYRPDLVQLNSAYDRKGVLRDGCFVPLARALGQTVIVKFHGSDLLLLAEGGTFWRLLTWMVFRTANMICVLSHEEARAFRARFPRKAVTVVKNALEFSRYQPRQDFRQRFGIPAGKPLLLFVARFIRAKGLHEVIRSLPIIREGVDVHTAVVGDGPALAECRELCTALSLRDHVSFTGYIPEDETVDAYLASDILVFPSYHEEGMPMVIWHSLACGLPIVTTPVRAVADWLEEGTHCLFVPPRDAERLAESVLRLLVDPALRERMRQHGPLLAQRFDRRLVAREFLTLYEAVRRNLAWIARTSA